MTILTQITDQSKIIISRFCSTTCNLNKPYCPECLFNHCSDKYQIGIMLDSDKMFRDELELCGLLRDTYTKDFVAWLSDIEMIFLGVNQWMVDNRDIAKKNYFSQLAS